jgi:RNA polymerase sigma-70 factor (ECF subfamily)
MGGVIVSGVSKDARSRLVPTNAADLDAHPAEDLSPDFEAFFTANWSRLAGMLFSLVGDREEAEDLALETFWRYYRRPPRSQDNVIGWLYRTAMNLGLNALRARRRRANYEGRAGRLVLDETAAPDPAEEVEQSEQRRQVRLVLAQMNPRSAKLLILRHSGLSYAEVASAININPLSVGKFLARAEAEFERLYRQSFGPGER